MNVKGKISIMTFNKDVVYIGDNINSHLTYGKVYTTEWSISKNGVGYHFMYDDADRIGYHNASNFITTVENRGKKT